MQFDGVARAWIGALVTLLLIGAAPDAQAQDTPNVRSAGRKLDLTELRAQPETNQVVVKFREGEKVRLTNQKLTGMRSGQANLLNNVLRQAGVTETALTPLFEAPPEELERDRQRRPAPFRASARRSQPLFRNRAAADGERRRGRQQPQCPAFRRICAAGAQARPAADLQHSQSRRSAARRRRGARVLAEPHAVANL